MIVHSNDKPLNDTHHSQCRLRHPDGRVTVGYIPTKCAVVGKVLGIEKEKGVWDDGWIVESAGEPRPTDLVRACERNYKEFSYGREHTHQ